MAASHPHEHQMIFTAEALGEVYTLPEAAYIWGKARKTIEIQCWKGALEYRKSITGGSILITRDSLVRMWGLPDIDFVMQNWRAPR